jgi:hypothetical protein
MCAFCAVLSSGPHWTEAGTDAGKSDSTPSGPDRYRDRAYRLKLVNQILGHFGCKAEDWAGGQYLVHSLRGQTEVVDYLPQIWTTVEAISKKPADPLDPELLGRLGASAPMTHDQA